MNENKILEEIKEVLQTQKTISSETELLSLYEWDSLSIMGVMALLKTNYNKEVSFSEIKACQLVKDIYKLVEK